MAKLTIAYGVIFILMGLYGYFGISSESITALIPTFFGIPMLVFGWLALNEKYLKHAMHGAAVLTLIGFAGTVGGLIKFFKMLGGAEMERPMIHSVPDAGAPSDAIRITGLVQSFGPITAVNNKANLRFEAAKAAD